MRGVPFNGTAFNDGGSFASISYLPPATVTIELALHERIAVSLSGTMDLGLSLVGDIARVSNIGDAPLGMGWFLEGGLTHNQRIYLGAVLLDSGLDFNGGMSTLLIGPSGSCEWGVEFTGDVDRRTYMSGITTMDMSPSGTLHSVRRLVADPMTMGIAFTGSMQLNGGLVGTMSMGMAPSGSLTINRRNYLPNANLTQGMALTGSLRGTYRLQGTISSTLNMTGTIANIKLLSGSMNSGFTFSGDLSNNAAGEDLDAFLMIRKPINREMTR